MKSGSDNNVWSKGGHNNGWKVEMGQARAVEHTRNNIREKRGDNADVEIR